MERLLELIKTLNDNASLDCRIWGWNFRATGLLAVVVVLVIILVA